MQGNENKNISNLSSPGKKIGSRLLFHIILGSVVVVVIITAIQLYLHYKQDLQVIKLEQQKIVNIYVPVLAQKLWLVDRREIQMLLEGIHYLPNVEYVSIVDNQGGVQYKVGQLPEENNKVFEHIVYRSYRDKYVPLGVLRVVFTQDHINQQLMANAVTILLSQCFMIFMVSVMIIAIFNPSSWE
ncbi:MAG: hypothetical protein OEM02_08970 [Desulfobulbaceae bacterium]|nr:hypothetical protein [Desulfobulbaceae bacterium]